MKHVVLFLLAVELVLGATGVAHATIYTYRNPSGGILSTDHPLEETRIRAEGWVLSNSKSSSLPIASSPAAGDGTVSRIAGKKLWALATTAILTGSNQGRFDLLGGVEVSPVSAALWKDTMRRWWDIEDRESLLSTLEWLEREGQRMQFDKYAALSPAEEATLLEDSNLDLLFRYKLRIVRSEAPRLKDKSILAWDYARYISLCGWGYVVGYITEDEAWQRILPIASTLQRKFDSWEDLGMNYLIGRAFWSARQTWLDGDEMHKMYEKLLQDPDSPWNTIRWDLDLS